MVFIRLKRLFKSLFFYCPERRSLPFRLSERPDEYPKHAKPKRLYPLEPILGPSDFTNISADLKQNLDYIKNVFTAKDNSDLIIREFEIDAGDMRIGAFVVFFDGMVNSEQINESIISPLLENYGRKRLTQADSIEKVIGKMLVENCTLNDVIYQEEVVDAVCFGSCALYIDGCESAFIADVKSWDRRSVGPPRNEAVLRGPQEAFVESIRTNTALIRKSIKDPNLIIEGVTIGKRSKTPCALLYVKDIANDSLVREVRRRLSGLDIDYLFDSGELEQLIEEKTYSLFPQMVATERPDKVCMALASGRVAVIVNGTPYVLVIPSVIFDYIKVTEDVFVRSPYSLLFRVVRAFAIVISLLLPGVFIAVNYYHQQMLPPELLFAIEASRENMPFPSIVELLLMEVAFELIREAGIRMPSAAGSTLGIVGGLILGQAAVAAGIVSPIMIIIVALTGISTFAVSNYSLEFALRVGRFIYILLGSTLGFAGITIGLFLQFLSLCASYSFGVPLLSPVAPRMRFAGDELISRAIWKRENVPDYVNAKKSRLQGKISRKWTKRHN